MLFVFFGETLSASSAMVREVAKGLDRVAWDFFQVGLRRAGIVF